MKIAVIGAGSTYTPELVSGISRERERLPVRELVLHDIDPERRRVVGGMAERMLEKQGYGGGLTVTDDLDRAVDGADFVLVQIRVGGQEARLGDETAPLRCGCVGQETTGAGGFAKALRTVPVVLEIAERVRTHAAPDAWIVDFTNPVGIVTRSLLDAGHRAVGLCNVAIGFQRRFAGLLGLEPSRVLVDQVGLNHLTWIRAVMVDGEDALPGLLEEHGEQIADGLELPRRLLDELGAIPSPYLRYFYRHDEVVEELRLGTPRAVEVAEIERQLLELYRDAELAEKPPLLEQRGGAFYSEAATALIASLAGDTGDVQVVDVRNGGAVPSLAEDDVVQLPGRIGADGPQPLPQPPLAPELLGLVQHVAAYERLTAETAVTRDPVTARKALLAHPLIGQLDPIERLLEDLAIELDPVVTVSRMTTSVVLAVDGGNSKTDLALVRGDGALLAHVRGPQSSPHHLGLAGCLDVLQALFDEAVDAAGLTRDGDAPVAHIGEVLLAGVDFPDEERELLEAVSARRWAARVIVGNDTFAVLRAGTDRTWGVAIVCGAGINCVGVGPDGRQVRFPALGAITGDWGGGYDVGLAALSAAARSGDGRGPQTVLERSVPAHFGHETPLEVARAIHRGAITSRRLVESAPLVFTEAAGDDVAAGIVDHLAAEIVALARAALERLDLHGEEVDVVLGGGLIRAGDERLLEAVQRGLAEVDPRATVRPTALAPVVGAALLGLDELDAAPAAHRRLRDELGRDGRPDDQEAGTVKVEATSDG